MQRVALKAVIGARALAEGGVLPVGGDRVELRTVASSPLRIDAGLRGEFGERRAALEIAGAQ